MHICTSRAVEPHRSHKSSSSSWAKCCASAALALLFRFAAAFHRNFSATSPRALRRVSLTHPACRCRWADRRVSIASAPSTSSSSRLVVVSSCLVAALCRKNKQIQSSSRDPIKFHVTIKCNYARQPLAGVVARTRIRTRPPNPLAGASRDPPNVCCAPRTA